MNYLDFVVASQKTGEARGLAAVCSAHPVVLKAAILHGLAQANPVLIESTCNQVNQFGGYTGMTPTDFARFVGEIADRAGFSRQNLILGGDHLGPLVWSGEPAAAAMEKAKALVRDYALAGFGKIHLDCSMPCADDLDLPAEIVVRRTAELAAVAEAACVSAGLPLPRYVIGTEVPPAGGANGGDDNLTTTDPADAARTIELAQAAFTAQGLAYTWERVVALVVQPGVEFGDAAIHTYDRPAAASLARFIETTPGLVYEAHSTDYQPRTALRELVEDHFAILKVGPGLTFAFREAAFALAEMEETLVSGETSHLRETLEKEMLANPTNWQKYYQGSAEQQKFARVYSFSDRIRYYWNATAVRIAFTRMMNNLGNGPLPLSLLSAFLPRQYERVRAGQIENKPGVFLQDKIIDALRDYTVACRVDGDGATL